MEALFIDYFPNNILSLPSDSEVELLPQYILLPDFDFKCLAKGLLYLTIDFSTSLNETTWNPIFRIVIIIYLWVSQIARIWSVAEGIFPYNITFKLLILYFGMSLYESEVARRKWDLHLQTDKLNYRSLMLSTTYTFLGLLAAIFDIHLL